MHASDGEIDFAEDAQLRAVGEGLGLPPEEFQELVVDIVEEVDSTSARISTGSATARLAVSTFRQPAADGPDGRASHHLAFLAISSAFCGHQLPAAGPWLQRPSDSPGGLSQ